MIKPSTAEVHLRYADPGRFDMRCGASLPALAHFEEYPVTAGISAVPDIMQNTTPIDPIAARRGRRGFANSSTARRRIDRAEQIVALLLFCWLVTRMWPESVVAANVISILLLLLSEGLVVLLLLLRRPTEKISLEPRDWLFAAAGTFLALLVRPGGDPVLAPLGAGLLFVGILLHLGAKLSLGRSFGLVAANRGVEFQGPYAFIRHPMYAGYMLCHVGFLLSAPSRWNAGLYIVIWSLLIARTFAEERILSEDPGYRDYTSRVRFRIVPGIF